MKFRCERDALVEQLGTASRAVSSRGGALPVLTGIHLKAHEDVLTMTGSDLEITVKASVSVAVSEPGEAVLPARIAVDIIRSLDSGAIEVEVNGEEAKISGGRSQFSVRTLPVDDFPTLTDPSGDEVTVATSDLAA